MAARQAGEAARGFAVRLRARPAGPLPDGAVHLLRVIAAVALSFAVGALLLAAVGIEPLGAYRALLDGGLLRADGLADTLVKTSPLLLAGLGVAIAFRAGVLNIGAEGQMSVGGVAAALVALKLTALPAAAAVVVAVLAAAAAGALMAGIAAALRVWRGVNEVVTTLLLNYVGVFLPAVLVSGWLKDPMGGGYPQSESFGPMVLPVVLPGTGIHAGLLLGLVAVPVLGLTLSRTRFGFNTRTVGGNSLAAERAGVNVPRTVLTAFCLSGALGGLAGAGEVLGLYHRLFENITFGYGYLAIVAALVGALHPVGVMVAAFFFAGLLTGGNAMQQVAGAPVEVVYLIQALTVMLVMADPARRETRRLLARRSRAADGAARAPVIPAPVAKGRLQ